MTARQHLATMVFVVNDTPGREIPKEYRKVAAHLVSVQGWRYDCTRKGHPMLFPPNQSWQGIPVPTTPSSSPRAWKNWLSQIRRAGGVWPPGAETR